MTEQELGVVIATAVKVAQAPLLERIASLEARLSMKVESAEAERLTSIAVQFDQRIGKLEKVEPITIVGPQGPAGERGEKGLDGMNGRDGADGLQGPQGETGPAGPKGDPGPQGPAGPSGNDGAAGAMGAKGLDGVNGADGKDGRDGQPGVPGRDGAVGPKGIDGRDGKDGIDGKDGLTTLESMKYEVSEDGLSVRFIRANGQPLGDWVQTAWLRPYDGVWREGESYKAGAAVTWAGSLWIARVDTTEKPQDGRGGTDWQLAVKSGRPGRDGKDGKDGLNGRDGRDGTDRIVQAHYGAGGGGQA